MKNKFCIITGAGGLLGFHHALALARINIGLVLVDINNLRLSGCKNKILKEFPTARVIDYVCDISNEKEIISLKKKLFKKNVNVEILINNAALNPTMNNLKKSSKVENYDIYKLKKEIDVNLISSFMMIKYFGPIMAKNKKGSIINIASDLAVNAPDHAIYSKSDNINNVKNFKPIGYSISKFGIIGLTKYISTYWAHRNVRCNALAIGGVQNGQNSFFIKNICKRIPMNRMANVNEYQKTIVYLSTDDSSYMNGHTLILDGGRSAW
jgi:NAD(P)-dependent dehydrogenase (short-subunit alcohol dehydrogenase family)